MMQSMERKTRECMEGEKRCNTLYTYLAACGLQKTHNTEINKLTTNIADLHITTRKRKIPNLHYYHLARFPETRRYDFLPFLPKIPLEKAEFSIVGWCCSASLLGFPHFLCSQKPVFLWRWRFVFFLGSAKLHIHPNRAGFGGRHMFSS